MLPNSFEELNRVRCFNHTIQLSAKALLKPFSSAGSIEADNETEYGDDGMPALQAVDNEDDDDDDEREELINNTEAVRTMLNKVCMYASIISSPLYSSPLLL